MTYTAPGLVHAAMSMHPSYNLLTGIMYAALVPGTSAWPAANRALYVPFTVTDQTWVRRLWTMSGNATGNVDLGIYGADWTRLVSTGSQAQGATNTVNFYSVTAICLPPGRYYLAEAYASTTATPYRVSATAYAIMQGVYQEANALPLPATATPVIAAAEFLPFFGFSTLAADL